MYLVSLSRRRMVEPVLTNAASRHTMPPLARLLYELPRARTSAVSPFAWGAAGCLPFLPRVRCGRAVLAPARWAIGRADLPGPREPSPVWAETVAALRVRLGLPTWVSVGTADMRLRLNLDVPMDLALLRAFVDGEQNTETPGRAEDDTVMLTEAASPADYGWLAGRPHEIVVPLGASHAHTSRAGVSARIRSLIAATAPLPVVEREHAHLPGAARVLFAKLYGDPAGFDTILTDHLPELLAAWSAPPRWWFVRYRDPAPHLRLRLHLADGADYGPAAARVGDWAAGLRRGGLTGDLVLDTYHPECARYGAHTVMEAAEALFAADSVAAVAQLALTDIAGPQRRAVTVASLVDLAVAVTGNPRAGMRWLLDHRRLADGPPADRQVLRQAISLVGVGVGGSRSGQVSAVFPDVERAWQARYQAAVNYADALAEAADHGGHLSVASVLGSLLHLHHIRVHGIDSGCEQACNRLARGVALAWNACELNSGEDLADVRAP
jgi:thiopeptide-type bacteriocin biosynthesis protein